MPPSQGNPDHEQLEKRREEKRVLKEFREHQQQVEDDKQDATNCHSEALKGHIIKANENATKVTTVDQALCDAQTFHKLAEYTGKQAEQLQSGLRTYDVSSFIDCLVKSMQGQDEDEQNEDEDDADDDGDTINRSRGNTQSDGLQLNFLKLGNSVAANFKTVPSLDFMNGNEPMEEENKSRVERKSRHIKKNQQVEKPDELKNEQVEQTETDKQVAMMKKELAKRKSINFWLFVIDPHDFTRSVENVFHSSFLIKESWAQLDLKCEPPTLKYRDVNQNESNEQDEHVNSGTVDKSEYIMEFDRVLWKSLINKYKIQDSFLPRTRPPKNDHRLQQMYMYEQGQPSMASF